MSATELGTIETIITSAIGAALLNQLATYFYNARQGRFGALYLALMLERYAEDCAAIAWAGRASPAARLPDFPNYRSDIETKNVSLHTMADVAQIELQVAASNRDSGLDWYRLYKKTELPVDAYFVALNALDVARKIRMRHGVTELENPRVEVTQSNLSSAAKKLYITVENEVDP